VTNKSMIIVLQVVLM